MYIIHFVRSAYLGYECKFLVLVTRYFNIAEHAGYLDSGGHCVEVEVYTIPIFIGAENAVR